MVSTINATSTGVATTADNSGILKVQSNGVTVTALAWGKVNQSTVQFFSSYNCSSVTRTATGNYTVAFTTPLADTNYSVVIGYAVYNVNSNVGYTYALTGSVSFQTFDLDTSSNNVQFTFAVFGNS